MKILGVVTARAGSARLPGKNLAMLGNRPLIAWSIEVGLATCHRVVTTTDGDEIARQAAFYGSEVVMRPPELSTGLPGLQEQAIFHAMENVSGGPYDAVLLLQPTSPFRDVRDVVHAQAIMENNVADSVVSMVRFPVEDALFKVGHAGRLRPAANQQDYIFTPNGAIFLARPEVLHLGPPVGGWFGVGAYAYEMPKERSIDIDTRADFDAAAAMLNDKGEFDASPAKKLAATP